MRATHSVERIVRTSDGVELAATVTGSAQGPITVVYVHGLLSTSAAWSRLVARVAEETGGRTDQVTFDLRGHGLSGWPPRESVTTFDELAYDLAAAIDDTTGAVVLVAHSIGTMIAQQLAITYPAQFAHRVRGLVFFNPAAAIPPRTPSLQRLLHVSAAMRPLRGHGPLDAVDAAGNVVVQSRSGAAKADAVPGGAHRSVSATDPRVLADALAAADGFRATPKSAAALGVVPVRLVAAQADRVTPPEHASQLAELIPGSSLDVVTGAGHALPRTRSCADAVKAMVDELDSHLTNDRPGTLPIAEAQQEGPSHGRT